MEAIEEFLYTLDGPERAIIALLHQRLIDRHGLIAKIRYRIPFYYQKSWICYLNPQKTGGVELVFIKGNMLSNEHGLLQKKDRKMVAGIVFHTVQEVSFEEIDPIIQEALLLEKI